MSLGRSPEALRGWAIPAAADITFAVAVLDVVGSNLPVVIRTRLLIWAVVDDLIVIFIIALYSVSGQISELGVEDTSITRQDWCADRLS